MAYSRAVFQCVLIGCVLYLASAVCSKFHFEEHVLEKLVRLEFRVEQMGENVNGELVDLKEKVKDLKAGLDTLGEEQEKGRTDLNDLQAGLDALAEEQEKGRTDLNDLQAGLDALAEEQEKGRTDLNDLKAGLDTLGEEQEKGRTDLNDLKAELGAEMSDLRVQEVAMLKKELGQKQSTGTSKGVAFVARDPPETLPNYALIPFRVTMLNVGDAYDDSTGRFTAPVSGIYSFTVQLCTTIGIVNVQLVVNNEPFGVSRQYEGSLNGVCSSMTTVAAMQAGEQAWVNCANSGGGVLGDSNSGSWNMFTGVLITLN